MPSTIFNDILLWMYIFEHILIIFFFFDRKESQFPFISTPIVKRHDAYTLEAADGVTVKVEGMINQTNTLKNGFSHEVCSLFSL